MNKLKDYREKKGLSQQKLAEITGIEQPSVAAYEAGKRTPTAKTAFLIFNTLVDKDKQDLKHFIKLWGFQDISK